MADEIKVEQPDDAGSTQVPEWVPEKFRSNPEAFGKSYEELESKLTQTAQQLREQQDQFEAYLSQQDVERQDAQNQQALPQYQDQLNQAIEQDPAAAMAWLAEQAAQRAIQSYKPQPDASHFELVADAAERSMEAKYNDWKDYAPRVAERIQQRGDVYPHNLFDTPQSTAGVLEEIYKTLRYDDLSSGAATLQTQQETDERASKQAAQTLSGAAGRPDTPNDDEDFFARLQAAANQGYSASRGDSF